MKDAIQSPGEEVSIVIYDAPLPPKYFRFSKRFIRTFFVFAPLFLTFTILGVALWGFGSRVKDAPKPVMPQVLEGNSKMDSLEAEIQELKKSNTILTEKLATQVPTASNEDPYLMTIKKPYGMQNLLSQNKVSLDQFEFQQSANKVDFKFQIISSTPETRVTGHVIVFMVSEAGILAWPKDANKNVSGGIKYSDGEPFAVSRLRPTDAEFFHRLYGESVKFIIYIFSREGDLLLIKETESYKVGAKA